MRQYILTVGVSLNKAEQLMKAGHPSYPIISVRTTEEALARLEDIHCYGLIIDAELEDLNEFLLVVLDEENGWPTLPVVVVGRNVTLDKVAHWTMNGVDACYNENTNPIQIMRVLFSLIATHIMKVRKVIYPSDYS